MEVGTEIALQYRERYDEMEALWREVEALDSDEDISSSLQSRIDSALASPDFGDKAYVLAQLYQAIMTEYDFLFSMAGESAGGLYASGITEIISARERFMDMYEKLRGNNYPNYVYWQADAVFHKGDRQTAPLQAA